jgi:transcriptional regulator with XRE-family HTH domain
VRSGRVRTRTREYRSAQLIYDMRTGAGLSQRALAKKVGRSASAINRLESDDYQGHTVAMVRRIATSLNRRLELRAVPVKRSFDIDADQPLHARAIRAALATRPMFQASIL